MEHFTTGSVLSADRTPIAYKVLGKGPGLLVIHGVFRASQHYLPMAEKLSEHFTVYLMDRRGRNESGPQGSQYSIEKETEDALAILQKHQIPFLFGHSYGGLVALNAALHFPLQKLALYEPAISIRHSLPKGWLPRFEKELARNEFVAAMITLIQGMQMGGPLNHIPRFLLLPLFRKMSRKKPGWKTNEELLALLPPEMREAQKLDSDIDRYRPLSLPVLLLSGKKSPDFLVWTLDELQKLLPAAQRRHLKGLGHNAPDEESPQRVAEELLVFFHS